MVRLLQSDWISECSIEHFVLKIDLSDLFERAVEKAPSKEAKKLFLLYAKFEEEYGLGELRCTALA